MSSKKDRILEKSSYGNVKYTLYTKEGYENIYYYFRWENKTYRGSTGTKKNKKSHEKVIETVINTKKGIKKKKKKDIVKFKKIVSEFLKSKSYEGLKDKTLRDYKRQSKYLIEYFGDRDIETFGSGKDYTDYQFWRFNYYKKKVYRPEYKRNGKTIKGRKFTSVGNYEVNREIRLLVNILRYSQNQRGHLKNVIISPYKILEEKRREEILEKDEYLKFHEYWEKENSYYWKIISFVNNTGIRYPSELNNIKWKDVNLKKNFVIIRDRKTKKKGKTLDTTLPLVGTSKKIIEDLKSRENISKKPNDYVFVNDNGVRIKNIGKAFKKGIKECGIDKKLTMYSLRHLYTIQGRGVEFKVERR